MRDIETNGMREYASVKAVMVLLEKLKRDGEIHHWEKTTDYRPGDRRTPENWDDRNGRDFYIIFKRTNGTVFQVGLQVKSSMMRVKEHYAWIGSDKNITQY